jgi:hypothetical protein
MTGMWRRTKLSTFKVDDVVKVLMPGEDIDGLIGEVIEVLDHGNALWPVKVKFFAPGYGDLTWVFFEDELVLVED